VQEQRERTPTRGDVLRRVHQGTLAAFPYRARLRRSKQSWRRRPASVVNSQAVGPLLLARAGHSPFPFPLFFLSVSDERVAAGLEHDDILRLHTPFLQSSNQSAAGFGHSVPTHIASVIAEYVRYERLATVAVTSRNHSRLVESLRAHPWPRVREYAPALGAEIVAASNV